MDVGVICVLRLSSIAFRIHKQKRGLLRLRSKAQWQRRSDLSALLWRMVIARLQTTQIVPPCHTCRREFSPFARRDVFIHIFSGILPSPVFSGKQIWNIDHRLFVLVVLEPMATGRLAFGESPWPTADLESALVGGVDVFVAVFEHKGALAPLLADLQTQRRHLHRTHPSP